MLEALQYCPVCEKDKFRDYLLVEDFTVSHEQFKLVQCIDCEFIFTNPRPSIETIGKYYQSTEYISHTNSKKGLQNKIYQWVRQKSIKDKLSWIEKLNIKQKSILDYGCGTGEFLSAAKVGGWRAKGLEINKDARELALSNYQLEVYEPSYLEKFNNEEFGVITLWHVLEHIHDLKKTVKQFKRCLIQDGILVIAVPNIEASEASYYGKFWAAYDVPRHLYHFSKKAIKDLIEPEGFKLIETRSLFFDPFYISLLSQKYKYGWSNPVSAFYQGINTTIKGKKEIEKNSSLLYIFKK
jgi:2-polyprenyl-3-methyl-5-hydroxy-6-metoxy-1,4-benzoquinol methylase